MKQETQSFFIALSILGTKCLTSFQEQTKKLEGTKTCFLTSLLPPPFSFCSYLLLYILAFFSEASKGLQQEILIIQFFSFVYFFLFFSFSKNSSVLCPRTAEISMLFHGYRLFLFLFFLLLRLQNMSHTVWLFVCLCAYYI